MEASRNDDKPNPPLRFGRTWLTGRSAPRLSPGLRPPSLCRCAERPVSQIFQARWVCEQCEPRTLVVEGDAVGGGAKSRRRPKAGGHSRSHPLRRPRPPKAWDSDLQGPLRQAALSPRRNFPLSPSPFPPPPGRKGGPTATFGLVFKGGKYKRHIRLKGHAPDQIKGQKTGCDDTK